MGTGVFALAAASLAMSVDPSVHNIAFVGAANSLDMSGDQRSLVASIGTLCIAASILACFPGDLFDSTGQFQSLWLIRLNNSAADAQVMLDELLGVSSTGSKHQGTAADRAFKRLRRP